MRIIDETTVRLAVELQQFVADYWHDVDYNRGLGAPDFYTDDCRLIVGSNHTFEGRAGVAEFYRYRSDRGTRTTAHTMSNFRVLPDGPNHAKITFVVVNYASDGPPPITNMTGPALVSQVECECLRGEDGCWRFKSLHGKPLFIGQEPYTVAVLVEGRHAAKRED